MAHTIQFVDQIASSPTTRLDLNSGSYEVRRAGIDLSPPNLKRVVVANMMRDGAEIPASAYENRVLRFVVEVTAANEDTLSSNLQTLDRELDRRNNILKWQNNGATDPVFFRTFRSPDYRRVRPNPQGLLVECHLEIIAEPFALGLQQTILNAQTITNDPAAGSNGMFIDTAATVKGDVPTPAYIEMTGVSALVKQLVAVRRHGTPNFIYEQAENMTNGTDAADTADASSSAGNVVRITPGTSTMVTRLTWSSFPRATPGDDDRGVYRVICRVKKNTAGDTWTIRQVHSAGGLTAYGPTVTSLASSANRHVLDLGLIQLPAGHDPVYDGYSNTQWDFEDSSLLIQAARTSGSGTFDIDYVALIPADEELAIAMAKGTAATWCWDGPMDIVRPQSGLSTFSAFERAGTIPMLAPNQVNRLFVVRQLGVTDAISDTVTITVKYWPRYLTPSRAT
jgi:hypothetical protein